MRTKGAFNMKTTVRIRKKNQSYILATESIKGHFFDEQLVHIYEDSTPKTYEISLPKIKVEKRLAIKNINFMGNRAIPLPSSKQSFKRLYKMMKQNENLEILIEGHTNGCGNSVRDMQILSENRALRIKNDLIEKKIDANRMKTIGYNCSRMLSPLKNATQEQQKLNRRVEILVTKM